MMHTLERAPMPFNPANLPPEVLDGMVELYRRELRRSFPAWARHVLAPTGYVPARHHELIMKALEAVAAGTATRQMIFLPPGSAKSTYGSILFAPWFLAQQWRLDLVAASHTVGLAEKFGRMARDIVAEHGSMLGIGLAGDGTAAGSWRLENASSYFAVGVGGSLTGRRADLAIIDDPVNEAQTDVTREHVWDWYNSVLLTRLKPGGRVVIIMTRWHQDDLAGRLLATQPGKWDVLRLPALAEADDPLGREIGAPLWGDGDYGYGAELIEKRDDLISKGATRTWSALYQQNPVPGEGALFQVAQIGTVDAVPGRSLMVRAWDLAATRDVGSRDPDWTVGVKLAREGARFVVADVVRMRGGPEEVERAIVATAQADGRAVPISLPQDPGQAGKAQVAYLTGKLSGWTVSSSPETGDKATRAGPVAAQCNVGNVSVLRAGWNASFLAELRDFPAGTKDDQVDALSRAFGVLGEGTYDSSMRWV